MNENYPKINTKFGEASIRKMDKKKIEILIDEHITANFSIDEFISDFYLGNLTQKQFLEWYEENKPKN